MEKPTIIDCHFCVCDKYVELYWMRQTHDHCCWLGNLVSRVSFTLSIPHSIRREFTSIMFQFESQMLQTTTKTKFILIFCCCPVHIRPFLWCSLSIYVSRFDFVPTLFFYWSLNCFDYANIYDAIVRYNLLCHSFRETTF